MKTIRINVPEANVKSFTFPDGQPHIQLLDLKTDEPVRVIAPIRNGQEMMNLLLLSNALDRAFIEKAVLVVPYLMGARSDRVMQPGDSVGVEVVAELINSCNFKQVNLFDVHSDVATALIKRSKNHNNSLLVKAYDKKDAVLIVPDAGAAKKVAKYLEWNPNIKDVVQCAKHRDLSDKGKITINILEQHKCWGKHCVIIDDLCDGGGTFTMIGEPLRNAWKMSDTSGGQAGNKPASLTLIVSHGIFSKGFAELSKYFDEIITSDSYASEYNVFKEYTNITAAINAYPGIKLTVVPIFFKL